MKVLPKVFAVSLSLLLIGCIDSKEKEVEVTDNDSKDSEEVVKPKSNPNLESSITAFLEQWSEKKGETVNTIITDNFDSVTGYYAYPFKVENLDKKITLDLGISKIEVPKQNVVSYGGFTDKVEELKDDSLGLAIVNYNNNSISQVEVHVLDYTFEEIQNSILTVDLSSAKEEVKDTETKEGKTYDALTADDWKGMALLTSREIVSKQMAPIFIVPNSSLTVERDLQDTFYYIIAGTLKSSSEKETLLESYVGKTITLNFGNTVPEEYINSPVWIHVVTQDGIIQNIEFQQFKGAELGVMAEGVIAHISVAAVTQQEDGEGSN